jgi:hypothetical protein
MATETVFYFDVLGFRQLAEGSAQGAVDALSALAEVLQSPAIIQQTEQWHHRYALSDSVFLTQADPVQAVRQASDLVFNLVNLHLRKENPVLVRGALAHGEVRHLKGIFLSSKEPANLVGDAVVEAVGLEHAGDMKGPHIFLSEQLAQTITATDPALAEWLLRPTVTPGVWEVLWLLPSNPAEFSQDEQVVKDLCDLSLQLLKTKGGHPHYGAHYREFALLAGRCLERVKTFTNSGVLTLNVSLTTFLPVATIKEIDNTTSGLPDEYVSQLLRLAEALSRP